MILFCLGSSFHELGIYDLPTIIDHILNLTKQEHLFYIGYSMGATAGFILCSTKPEYNQKIKHFVSFAPYATVVHEQTAIQKVVLMLYQDLAVRESYEMCSTKKLLINYFQLILRHDNIAELFPRRSKWMEMLTGICRKESNLHELCIVGMFLITGVDYSQLTPVVMFQCG